MSLAAPINPTHRAFSFWTEEDVVALRSMSRQGFVRADIAKALFRSSDAVRVKAGSLKLHVPTTRREMPLVDLEGLQKAHPFERGGFILSRVAQAYNMTPADIASKYRHANLVEARQHAVYLIAKHTTLSLPQMGRILGGRDHTTILFALRVMNQRMGDDVRGSGGVPMSKILAWKRYKDARKAARAA